MPAAPPIAARRRPHTSGVRPLLPPLIALGLLACADPPPDGRCATERDCRPGQICVDGLCGGAPACALDADCAARQICLDGACSARSCRDEGDCPDRPCIDGWCRPPASGLCADDRDCPSGACVDGRCTVDPCPATGCAALCGADEDCPDDGYCAADALCRTGCRFRGCPAETGAALCDPQTRRCVRVECARDGDCPDDAWCAGDACRPGCRLDPDTCPGRCDRSTRRCGCADDRDCPADDFCADDGVCRPGCRAGGCGALPCDPISRRCEAPTCGRDVDCGDARVCGLDDLCRAAIGPRSAEARCEVGAHCASGRCVDGRCQGRCAADADCPSGRCALVGAHLMCAPPPDPCAADAGCPAALVCRVWRDGPPALGCRDPVGEAAGGAPCAEDERCAGGLCLDGRCWAPCAADEHCPGRCLPAMVRLPVDPAVSGGALALFAGCLDPSEGSGAGCAGDRDCPDDEACGLWPDGSGFEGRCRIAAAPARGGEPCPDDGGCRGRWCVGGRCVAPCIDGDDPGCAAGAACVDAELETRLGATAVARVCGAEDPP